MIKTGVTWLGLSIFFAGAAFQEAIDGTILNHPDGGHGSLVFAIYAALVGWKLLSKGSAHAG